MQDFSDLAERAGARFARMYAGPEDILKSSGSKMDTLWRIWAVGVALVRWGDIDNALYWINEAMHQLDKAQTCTQMLLIAELYAALGLTQYEEGNERDGRLTLDEAEHRLRDLTTVALESLEQPGEESSFAFAQQIRQMVRCS
jgi:hypothetical protein